jgi:hypothetical protein
MELQQRTEQVLAHSLTIRRIVTDARRERWSSPAGREVLHQSLNARLLARLETMPVIEQAKGIIMAQSHCGQAEAFDMLRRASQRSNVPVRDLAARIVANTAGSATPAGGPAVRAVPLGHPGTRTPAACSRRPNG